MGLDIYLRKCADLPTAIAQSAAAESETNALWEKHGTYESIPDDVKTEIRNACNVINAKHGCTGQYGQHGSIVRFDEQPSAIAPDHLFKIGYFRSSYNEGGIERVMRNLGLPGLHEIFQAPGDGGDFAPDWSAALDRCATAIHGYEAHLASDMGKYGVTHVRPMFEFGATDDQHALALFAEQLQKQRDGSAWNSFTNRDGEFHLAGMKAVAFITKKHERATNPLDAMINGPSIFVVYEKPAPEDGKEDWYLTALRIVKETIDFVLAQPDKQHFYLVWSG